MQNLQYITDHKPGISIEDQVEAVCKGGCRWVQLRMKDASSEERLTKALAVKKICEKYDTLFLINDDVEVVLAVDCDGVHLGKEDMPPSEARKILGNEKIIGATCNTFQDIKKAISEGANYVGVGPYRFTTTKKKLSPVLGLEGYKNIMNQMAAEKLSIPILAIGGIEEDDIAPLMQTGIHGIALSGLIKNAANIEAKTKTIIEKLENV